MAGNLNYRFGQSQLTLEFGDIVTSDAQVIVSSDDAYLSMSDGVSAAIRRAGGDDIVLDAAKKIPAALGSVVVTTAGKLPAHYVFHVISRSPNDRALPEDILRNATQRCMQLVGALEVHSIAFPAIGAGYAKFSLDKVAAEMAKVIAEALTNSSRPITVTIYLHDDKKQMREIDFIPFIARFAARVPEFAEHRADVPEASPSEEGIRNKIFISYSHKNKDWLDRLQTMLKPLVRNNSIAVWDDRQIRPGAQWRKDIQRALSSTKVAVLLVSPDFLASDFIAQDEVVPLLKAAEKEGVSILWICVSACLYDETGIEAYQAAHDISRPLDSLTTADCNAALVTICREIKKASANA
jgi:O-acetyl-ADP-ribose deacetylase (regulator of RNase III)